jgi:hypothetical protein
VLLADQLVSPSREGLEVIDVLRDLRLVVLGHGGGALGRANGAAHTEREKGGEEKKRETAADPAAGAAVSDSAAGCCCFLRKKVREG